MTVRMVAGINSDLLDAFLMPAGMGARGSLPYGEWAEQRQTREHLTSRNREW
jgi:hypothetical protein